MHTLPTFLEEEKRRRKNTWGSVFSKGKLLKVLGYFCKHIVALIVCVIIPGCLRYCKHTLGCFMLTQMDCKGFFHN